MEKEENQNNDLPEGWNSEPFVDTIEEFKTKQTEIGKIPEGWEIKKIEEVVMKTEQIDPKHLSGIFEYIDVSSISREFLRIENTTSISKKNAPGRARKLVETGDVIIATVRPTLKRLAFVEKEYDNQICSTAFCVLRSNSDLILDRYLFYAIQHPYIYEILETIQRGASYPAVTDKNIRSLFIPLPSKEEQQKIAAVLYNIQKAIETQDAIIKTTRELKKSTMQHLFTQGLRGEKTKQTEIGEIPERWDVVQIKDIGEIITGTTPPTANQEFYNGGGYQFISPNDIGRNTKIYSTEKEISEKGLNVSRILPKYSVCFVCIGSTIGKVGITVKEKSTTNQQINTIVTNSNYDPFFITYLLNYKSTYIASFASPSPVPILSKGKFSEISIMVTYNKDEQKQISHTLLSIDQKIEIHGFKKCKLQELFNSMLNNLMIGDICVKDLSIDTKINR